MNSRIKSNINQKSKLFYSLKPKPRDKFRNLGALALLSKNIWRSHYYLRRENLI